MREVLVQARRKKALDQFYILLVTGKVTTEPVKRVT